jgi:hypothetical protein
VGGKTGGIPSSIALWTRSEPALPSVVSQPRADLRLIMKDGSIRHVFPLKGVSWEFWSFQRWLPRDRKSRLGSLGYILSKDLPTKLAGRFNKNAAPRD